MQPRRESFVLSCKTRRVQKFHLKLYRIFVENIWLPGGVCILALSLYIHMSLSLSFWNRWFSYPRFTIKMPMSYCQTVILFLLERLCVNFTFPKDFFYSIFLFTLSVQLCGRVLSGKRIYQAIRLLILSDLPGWSYLISSNSVCLFSGVLLISISSKFSVAWRCLF